MLGEPGAVMAKATEHKFLIQIKRQRDFSRQTHDDDKIYQVSWNKKRDKIPPRVWDGSRMSVR